MDLTHEASFETSILSYSGLQNLYAKKKKKKKEDHNLLFF